MHYNNEHRSLTAIVVAINFISALTHGLYTFGKLPVYMDAFGNLLLPTHYIMWAMTTLQMIWVLSHISQRPNEAVLRVLLTDIGIFVLGFVAVVPLDIPALVRSMSGVLSFVCFLGTMNGTIGFYREASAMYRQRRFGVRAAAVVERTLRSLRFQVFFMLAVWGLFPATWLLSNAGLFSWTTQDLLYCALNYASKVLFANSTLAANVLQLEAMVSLDTVKVGT